MRQSPNSEATMRYETIITTRSIEARVAATRERHARAYLYAATAKGRWA
jgi:hypothetical protein